MLETTTTEANDSDRLLTAQQVAEYFGVSINTIRRARMWGTLFGHPAPPSIKFPNGTIRFKKSVIEAWMNEVQQIQ